MSNKFKSVRCKSGIMGSRYLLKDCYSDFDEFEGYCDIYNFHTRLGYKTPESAWKHNPMIESSINCSDFRKVKKTK
jgi:hypothetical protein